MTTFYALPALVTGLAMILYFYTFAWAGKARYKYGVVAPSVTGSIEFERIYRVQMNTLEQLIFFLPSLWLFAVYLNAPKISAALGLVWVIGRVMYAQTYAAGKNRGGGFMISFLVSVALLLGGIGGIAMHLYASAN